MYTNNIYMGAFNGTHQSSSTNTLKSLLMLGPINMNGNNLKVKNPPENDHSATSKQYVRSFILNLLIEALLLELYQTATTLDHFSTANSSQVMFNSSNYKVSKIFDQSLSANNATQTNSNNQPTICPPSQRINNQYYINFSTSDGSKQRLISDINLNLPSAHDKVLITIAYRLFTNQNGHWVSSGFFSHDDQGFDKFCLLLPNGDLIISGTLTISF